MAERLEKKTWPNGEWMEIEPSNVWGLTDKQKVYPASLVGFLWFITETMIGLSVNVSKVHSSRILVLRKRLESNMLKLVFFGPSWYLNQV